MSKHAKIEVEMHDKKLEQLQSEISAALEKLPQSQRRAQDLDEVADSLTEFDKSLSMMRAEMGALDVNDKKTYMKRSRDYQKAYEKLSKDYDYHKNLNVKADLLSDNPEVKVDLDTQDGLIQHGRNIMSDSKESLERSLQAIGAASEAGRNTALQLDRQFNQLGGIKNDLGTMESTLARTNKVVRRIARKMSTDKLLWVVVFFVFVAVVAIIIYKAVANKNPSGVNASTTPPT